jgi:hypothetical protein
VLSCSDARGVDRYGAEAYAGIAGTLALPATLAKAAAPLAAAIVATSLGGYTTAMAGAAAACATAGALLGIASRQRHSGPDGVEPK